MTPAELRAELEAGRLRPAYLIAGEEALLRDDSVAALRRAVLAGVPADFNYDRLFGDSTQAGQLLDAARALPVLAARRLVWLSEPEGRSAAAKALVEVLAELVLELRQQDSTILVVTAARVDRRTRWVKSFQDPASVVHCEPPKGSRAVVAFAREEAERAGVALDRGAAEALAEAVGPQLLLLRQEIEKAALYAGPGVRVTRRHVAATACVVAEEPIWDLTDAIGEGRASAALEVLHRLLSGGAPAPVLLASLAGHFRKLTRTRSGAAVAGHPFMVRKLQSQAQRYAPARLAACLRAIHQVDEALKGRGAMPPEMALERLVIGLTG